MDFKHVPVLFDEAVKGLEIKQNAWYIDGTIGGGGHASEILRLGGRVLGIDTDEDAIKHLKKKFESELNAKQLILAQANFADIEIIAAQNEIKDVNGILLDLGVSSYQLDSNDRGFSIRHDGPLDMRMSAGNMLTAEEIVNTYSFEELYEIFAKYGEEPNARKFAGNIVQARKNEKIKTTKELVDILVGTENIGNFGGIHPATRVFQALRIAVNDEIGQLKKGLDSGFKLLKGATGPDGPLAQRGGRLEVISFHSLEDRVVKLKFLELERQGTGKIITKKPTVASESEINKNKRSRSAKMRIIEKI